MKKFYQLSVFYAILGIIGGVFYREFTKFNNFEGVTTLGFVHTHALVLGMFFFLILLLLEKQFKLTSSKKCSKFLGFYNVGLITTITMLIVRGVLQVLNTSLSSGLNASISGISGLGHIILGIGMIYFFLILKERLKED